MFWGKKLAYYLFFMAILLWASCLSAMEKGSNSDYDSDEDMHHYTDTAVTVLDPHQDGASDEESAADREKSAILKTYFEEIKKVNIAEGWSQVLGGVVGGAGGILAAEFFVPFATTGLSHIGLTKDVLSAYTWYYPAGIGTLPATAGAIAGYNAGKNLIPAIAEFGTKCMNLCSHQESDEARIQNDVARAKNKATERPRSIPDFCTYSYGTQLAQMVFWGGLYLAIIMHMESGLDEKWGSPFIWDTVFEALSLVYIYFFTVQTTNNSNKRIFRSFNKNHEDLMESIEDAAASLKHQGITEKTKIVGLELHIIDRDDQEDETDTDEEQVHEGIIKDTVDSQKPHLSLFKKTQKAAHTFRKDSPAIRFWERLSEKISPWTATAIELAGLPMKHLVSYALPYKAMKAWGVSEDDAMIASISIAIAACPFILASTLKEAQLTKEEIKQALWLFKPQVTCGYWGERLAPFVLARGSAFVYVALPVSVYLLNEILLDTIGIENFYGRLALVAPFAAGSLWASSSKFFETQFSQRIANWVAKGAEVYFACCDKGFPIFPCISKKRKQALDTLERLRELQDKVRALNIEYASHLCRQLGIEVAYNRDASVSCVEESSLGSGDFVPVPAKPSDD